MKTIKYNYSQLSQPSYIEKIGFIIFCLTNNLSFPALPVITADITAKLLSYENTLDKSRTGDHVSTTKAHSIRKELDLMLKKNGIYINFTANGDEAILESSGYDLSKERTLTPKPEVEIIPTSQPGQIKVIIRKVEGAVAYQVQICPDVIPDPSEQQMWLRQPMNTRIYQMIDNLDLVRIYYLRFCSVSKYGETPWSMPFRFRLA